MGGVIQDGQQVGVQSYTRGLELTLFDNPPRLTRHLDQYTFSLIEAPLHRGHSTRR